MTAHDVTSRVRPWSDPDLPVARRAAALLAAMTLQEKVGQLHQVANPDPERDAAALAAGTFGTCIVASGQHAGNVRDTGTQATAVNDLQRAAVQTSRLGIPLIIARDVIHGHRTVFPVPLGQAASFDAELVRDCARVAAREATADGVRWTFAPMLDVAQDPRWGRVAEGWGEDVWLASHLGVAAVEGFQGGPDGGDLAAPEAMAACAKHYVGYGLVQGGRDYAEVDIGPITLHNRHLRPFRAVIDAGVATVMSAFHTLDAVPVTAHVALLREHLRDDLGFTGPVVSDWGAVGELRHHGMAADDGGAAVLALRAGVDIDMVTGAYSGHLARLVGDGVVDEALVDEAVLRVLTLKLRLGLFEDPYTDPSRAAAVHLTPEHRGLARRAAASAVVVLRNDGVLPLEAPPRHVHVTGPFATATGELFGTWTLDGRAEDVVSIAAAVSERFEGTAHQDRPTRVTVDDGRFPDESHLRAREADVVIACVGEHPLRSGEANSVASLDLPPGQVEHLEALARVSRRLVVVVLTGRPLALERLAHLGSALVLVFHPGVEGGHGVVDVLSGDAPASGRLPSSLPWTTGQVPLHHDHLPTGRPLHPDGPEGRYRDHRDTAQYPFGFGLGYSPVTYTDLVLSATVLGPGEVVRASVRVTNVGTRPVVETVQLYARAHVSTISRPVSELVGVRRVVLAPGEQQEVGFEIDQHVLSHRDALGRERREPGPFTLRIAPYAGAGVTARLDVVSSPARTGTTGEGGGARLDPIDR
ncbi:glycoside hydrolase family 3 N-terminal domain-containing protein [Actinotalea sp. K2]|uniref:glycoside hydrolase family 3 N-terminal domain-containing protein n=1 Tax=Actinotalea sp. K2 TaxID=2939438 RepID=UPI002016BCBD|nr:glycoside hydrolase family 3 N-terminal domain-containing protein [Actinotalea sp. K2]MCL3861238.1 glycoside hydrolase family 3 C-terminal domain-containing protein [Actinotalea sp. K2]